MDAGKANFYGDLKAPRSNCRTLCAAARFLCANLFFILTFSFVLPAQDIAPITAQNFHQWGAVTLFSGLPSDNVRAIAQTADGVLWLGTDNGLARFDGRRVSTVVLETGESSKILALKVSGGRTLWVGTERGAYFQRGDKFFRVEETADSAITSIFFSANIYLSTANGVILRLTEKNDNTFSVEKIPAEQLVGSDGKPLKITGFAESNGKVIAATRSRSFLILEDNQFSEIFSRPRPFFINVLTSDAAGNVLFGTDAKSDDSGFFSLPDVARPEKIDALTGNVSAIEIDAAGGAWVGTEKNGLFYFRDGRQIEHFTFENTAGGLRSNTVYALFADREGVLWAGTNRGVSRFDALSPFNQILSEKNANSNFVRVFYQAKNAQIYAGTNRGLFLFSNNSWQESERFSAKIIYSVAETPSNQFLVGASGGLFNSDGKQLFAGDVRAIANFQGRTYIAVFGRGIFQAENQTPVFINETTNSLYADGEKLWIGTTKGDVYTFDGKEIKPETSLENLRGGAIRKISRGSENDWWFGGERGLFRLKDGELQNVIPNRDVRDFLVSEAEIWAATLNGGLLHLKRDENFGWISSDLNVEQGLPSEQIFALLRLEKNHFLIGTNRGVSRYLPSAFAPQIIAARILSQRLHSSEEAAQLIKLEYPQNSILVEVAGLSSRTFPEQFQYEFFLKNSSGEILDKKLSGDAQFAPANLAAGEYQIEVRAFNKDLLVSEPLIIRFSIDRAPFPWTAAWLGVLLAVAVVALIWAGIERKRISNRNRELAAARFDLANEAERERKRIARDLHDQTLADLRELMLMSDKLPAETGNFRQEIESVSTEIRRICEDLSPSVLENVGLAAALEFLLSHTIENSQFSAREDLEEKLNFSPNEQMQIYRIAQEVLNNIKRHSTAEKVLMNIEIAGGDKFTLSISDDGTPFAPSENKAKGRGIANIKSRAALIEAEVSWQKIEIGGTLFILWKSTR